MTLSTVADKVTPSTVSGWAAAIGHAILGGGVIYAMVTKRIDPTAGAAILAGMGGFWSGVGAALKSAGPSVAATTAGGASVAPGAAPATGLVESGAPGDHPGTTAPVI